MLELHQISKTVGLQPHIYPTSITFARDGLNILLGPTNAGKTTLMKIIAGLDSISTGRITLDGKTIHTLTPQQRNVSFVHQLFINYPHLTTFENIASPLRVQKLSYDEVFDAVTAAAKVLQIDHLLDKYPHTLSGGQQQRVALARAVIKKSDIVLLDEPLANLDYKLREELREQLPTIFASRGAVVIYATSDPNEALILQGRTAAIYDGRAIQFGATSSVYHRPNNLAAAQVFSDPPLNTHRVVKKNQTMHFNEKVSWQLQGDELALPDGEYTLGIRAHDVYTEQTMPRMFALDGTVMVSEISGSASTARIDIADSFWVTQSSGVHEYPLGESKTFYADLQKCYYFNADGSIGHG